MATSSLGIRLQLLIGRKVPAPAPAAVMRALTRVEVRQDARGEGDGFQMTFALGKDLAVEYGLLASGVLDPDRRVALGVLFGAVPDPLVNGVIYHHQVSPSAEPGRSTLTVSGRDVSVLLDLEEKHEQYRNRPDSVVVDEVLLPYAADGIAPPHQVTPTADVALELERVTRQHATDLSFLRELAERNGFVFYLEPRALGLSSAYWGLERRPGSPQPALSIGLGPASNVRSLAFTHDALAPVASEGRFIEPVTKTSVRIPPLPPPRVPFALSETQPRRTVLLRDTAGRSPSQAATASVARALVARDAVAATGELDAVRYGRVLRARRPVGVRGAGVSYDGLYYVERVTHVIERGSYRQSFELSREGVGALAPVVRP
jgi:hypothetical protein